MFPIPRGYHPSMADDPRTRYPDAVNGPLLDALAEGAAASAEPPGPWTPGGWTLRTHPDLEEALRGRRKSAAVGHAYGYAVLAGRGGRIYALARSPSRLSFLLPGPEGGAAAAAAGAGEDPALGPGWWTLNAWRSHRPAAETGALLEELSSLAERSAGEASRPPGSR